MAGTDVGFDAAAFRTAIKTAMVMGSPNTVALKATFQWRKAQTFATQDPAGRPYNLTAPPVTDTTPSQVVLDEVAVEYAVPDARGTTVGEIVPRTATVTLLDEQYAQVQGADFVLLSGRTFEITTVTALALFEVNVYQLHCQARS